jgi:hypothetical protein
MPDSLMGCEKKRRKTFTIAKKPYKVKLILKAEREAL